MLLKCSMVDQSCYNVKKFVEMDYFKQIKLLHRVSCFIRQLLRIANMILDK